MNVFLDVHADRHWLQCAVACSIAASHEDLRKRGINSFTFGSALTKCRSKYCIKRNESLLGILINNHGAFSLTILPTIFDYQAAECSIDHFEFEQIPHSLRINFGVHQKVLHEFFIHHAVLNQVFIHHDVLVTFPSFPPFVIHQNLQINFATLPPGALRHVQFPTNASNSLLLTSPASSPRYRSNTSPM